MVMGIWKVFKDVPTSKIIACLIKNDGSTIQIKTFGVPIDKIES